MGSLNKFLVNLGRNIKKVSLPALMLIRKNSEYSPLSGNTSGLVVSLTAIPTRMDKLWVCIDSLFRQSIRPDKIVIELTQEEYPGGLSSLPQSLTRLQKYGVEIAFENTNLKCHNKYFYVMQKYPDATIITVDDDCYYKKDMIMRLVNLSNQYPGAVCTNIAAVIDPDNFYEYKKWKKSTKEHAPSNLCVALGFAGVLYPSHILPKETFDIATINKLSPRADDLYLKAFEASAGVKVACGSLYPKPVTINGSQKVSLRKTNKGTQNRNDIQWKALDEYFDLKALILK